MKIYKISLLYLNQLISLHIVCMNPKDLQCFGTETRHKSIIGIIGVKKKEDKLLQTANFVEETISKSLVEKFGPQ